MESEFIKWYTSMQFHVLSIVLEQHMTEHERTWEWYFTVRRRHPPLARESGLQAALQARPVRRGHQGLQQRHTHLRQVLHHLHVGHVEAHRGRPADHGRGQLEEHGEEHRLLQELGGRGAGREEQGERSRTRKDSRRWRD